MQQMPHLEKPNAGLLDAQMQLRDGLKLNIEGEILVCNPIDRNNIQQLKSTKHKKMEEAA